jgi:flagellar biosynthesis/type III secretory pathway M-ring protein FliF/YscJ
MFLASILAFFVVIFLLATITVAIAWMTFLKRQAEGAEAAREASGEPQAAAEEDSLLFRN